MLRYVSDNLNENALTQIVSSRLRRSAKENMDVVLISKDGLLKVLRYTNNKEK